MGLIPHHAVHQTLACITPQLRNVNVSLSFALYHISCLSQRGLSPSTVTTSFLQEPFLRDLIESLSEI